MKGNQIDGITLREMIIAAATLMETNKQQLNDLNVFPVPDGDTGTNMSLTMKSVLKEVSAVADVTVPAVSEALSRGALKGARGNSGVILSQLFRGMARHMGQFELVDSANFALAMKAGVETAYKAVMKPKEGTILTVSRVMAEKTCAVSHEKDIIELIDLAVTEGEEILRQTPEMLPVLKKAGVVDAGGQGLLVIYHAFKMVLHGEVIPEDATISFADAGIIKDSFDTSEFDDLDNIAFAYCTEFFVQNLFDYVGEQEVDKLRDKLSRIGDSLVVVGDKDLVKVHVHTNSPGKALQYALMLGELDRIKIDNMVQQNREVQQKKAQEQAEMKEVGVVAVASGEGLENVFKDLGVDAIISGGQTMNPSIEDITKEIKKVNAKSVVILPNNSNIILAAQQAQEFTDKKIFVIPTKTMPQGIAAMLAYNPDGSGGENAESMQGAFENVLTGHVTYAVRDTNIDGREIHQGDYLGLTEGDICCTGQDMETVAYDVILHLAEKMSDLITIYYGQDSTQEQAEQLAQKVREQLPDTDVEILSGGQPVYYYIISAE